MPPAPRLSLVPPPEPIGHARSAPTRWTVGWVAATALAVLAAIYFGTSCGGSTPHSARPAARGGPQPFPSLPSPPADGRLAGTSLLRDLDVLALRLHRGRVSEAHWRGWLRQPARVRRGTP
jgi:hypothetical protein